MYSTWNKYIDIRVDVYKNDANLAGTQGMALSWTFEREDGSDFETCIKPTPERIGTLPHIQYYSTISDLFKASDLTPHFTTNENGERIDVSTNIGYIGSELLQITEMQPLTIVNTQKFTFPADFESKMEYLYHIQIPLINVVEGHDDYVSVYVIVEYEGNIGSTSAKNAALSAMTFINKATIELNSYSAYRRRQALDLSGLVKVVYDATIYLVHSEGLGNSDDLSAMVALRYIDNNTKKNRLFSMGGTINANLLKRINTVTPNITP